MILRYGNYTHAANECTVARTVRRVLNARQFSVRIVRTWDVKGTLQADDARDLITKKNRLERAYWVPYQDLVLLLDDGTVHDSLRNAGSTTGVVPQGPDFPTGEGAEGGTYLTYALSAEAAFEFEPGGQTVGGAPFEAQQAQQVLEEWVETLTETGGGPRYVVVDTVGGDPVRQLLNRKTKYRYTQVGQATGRYGFPTPPGPKWPEWENAAERSVTNSGPVREGIRLVKYTTSWSYQFESTTSLSAPPSPWTI